MATNDPVGTVQRMFAAFRVGDVDAVLDTVNADTRWTYLGANPKPTKADVIGKAGRQTVLYRDLETPRDDDL